jgi:hypothetical protein
MQAQLPSCLPATKFREVSPLLSYAMCPVVQLMQQHRLGGRQPLHRPPQAPPPLDAPGKCGEGGERRSQARWHSSRGRTLETVRTRLLTCSQHGIGESCRFPGCRHLDHENHSSNVKRMHMALAGARLEQKGAAGAKKQHSTLAWLSQPTWRFSAPTRASASPKRGRFVLDSGDVDVARVQAASRHLKRLAAQASANLQAPPVCKPSPAPRHENQGMRATPLTSQAVLLGPAEAPLWFDPASLQPVVTGSDWDTAATEAWLWGLRLELTSAEFKSDLLANPLRNGTLLWDLACTLTAVSPRSALEVPLPDHPLHSRRPSNLHQARILINAAMRYLGLHDPKCEGGCKELLQSKNGQCTNPASMLTTHPSQKCTPCLSESSKGGVRGHTASGQQPSRHIHKPSNDFLDSTRGGIVCAISSHTHNLYGGPFNKMELKRASARSALLSYDERLAMIVEDVMQGQRMWELLTHVRVAWEAHVDQQEGVCMHACSVNVF